MAYILTLLIGGIYWLIVYLTIQLILQIKGHPDEIKLVISAAVLLLTPLAKEIIQTAAQKQIERLKKYLKKIFSKKKKTKRLKIPDEEI